MAEMSFADELRARMYLLREETDALEKAVGEFLDWKIPRLEFRDRFDKFIKRVNAIDEMLEEADARIESERVAAYQRFQMILQGIDQKQAAACAPKGSESAAQVTNE